MKTILSLLFAAFLFVSAASAATVSQAGSMATAARALRYPRPGALKLTCHGLSSFKCVATYPRHRKRVFYAKWQGGGGWVCAGAKIATCKVLRHGFITTSQAANTSQAAELAVFGYIANTYPNAQKTSACGYTAMSASCGYQLPSGPATVTVTLKQVKAGYITTATVS
jgi:hypothetical protein